MKSNFWIAALFGAGAAFVLTQILFPASAATTNNAGSDSSGASGK